MSNFPYGWGADDAHGACSRLQNFLLCGNGSEIPDLTFGQIFGDPLTEVIGHCAGRIEDATKVSDSGDPPLLHPLRKDKVLECAECLRDGLTDGPNKDLTLESLMVTDDDEWPEVVKTYSNELEGLGISLPHKHRAKEDIARLQELFAATGNFYKHLGEMTPRLLFTADPAELGARVATINQAAEAHALMNHLDMLETVDPREPLESTS